MKALIVGIGDAFTCRWFGSSAVVQAPTGQVLIDCPDLIHRALHEASAASTWHVTASTIDDIILTHLHGDHCNGLESFAFHRRIMRLRGDGSIVPRLHVTAPVAARVWERLAPAMDAPMGERRPSVLSDYFDLHMLNPHQPATIAGLSVQCRFTRHPVPTIGLLLSAGQRTLGWSGDTPFDAGHVQWLSGADVIVHESNLGSAHTPIESLNALDSGLHRRMRLIHLPDDFDQRCTDIRPLVQGEIVEV
jgi:ribonuclease BN (tRNA processing enzyme)